MSAASPSERIAHSLRPVVVVVIATKMTIAAFLVASMAGIVPMPTNPERSTAVYLAEAEVAE